MYLLSEGSGDLPCQLCWTLGYLGVMEAHTRATPLVFSDLGHPVGRTVPGPRETLADYSP